MAAKENTVLSKDVSAVRAVDMVTRFARDISLLKNIFPNIQMIKHNPGDILYSRKADVTLNTATVGEGEEIPYNPVVFTDVPVGNINWDKQSVGVTLETIAKRGYEASVQKADDDMLFKIENGIATRFVNFIKTGTLESDYTTATFQSAVAEAVGQVSNAWENFNLGYTEVIGFVNTLDLYRYLGGAPLNTQREFGLEYVKDFLGCSKLFFSSKIPAGEVYATPAENIIMDYIDAANSDFNKAGFEFVTDGERNLIGVVINPNNSKLVSELIMVNGVGLRAEYLNGIAKIKITTGA